MPLSPLFARPAAPLRSATARGAAFALLPYLALACSDDDSGSSTQNVEERCQVLAQTWCGRAIECLVQLAAIEEGDESELRRICETATVAALDCSNAVRIDSGYDQCLTDIEAMPCTSWDRNFDDLNDVELPGSCRGVVRSP